MKLAIERNNDAGRDAKSHHQPAQGLAAWDSFNPVDVPIESSRRIGVERQLQPMLRHGHERCAVQIRTQAPYSVLHNTGPSVDPVFWDGAGRVEVQSAGVDNAAPEEMQADQQRARDDGDAGKAFDVPGAGGGRFAHRQSLFVTELSGLNTSGGTGPRSLKPRYKRP